MTEKQAKKMLQELCEQKWKALEFDRDADARTIARQLRQTADLVLIELEEAGQVK